MSEQKINETVVSNLSDEQLDELMAYTPDFSEISLANIEARTLEMINNRPGRKLSMKRLVGIVAAVIALLATTTAVFATGWYWSVGGFDDLINIVSGDRAELLQPVDVVNRGIVTDDGIRIELIAVSVFDNMVDIYMTMEDMESNRLDNDFHIGYSIDFPRMRGDTSGLAMSSIVSRTDCGIVTLYARRYFFRPSRNTRQMHEVTFELRTITYSIVQHQDYVLDICLSVAVLDAPTFEMSAEGLIGYSDYVNGEDGSIRILEPHLHDIELGLDYVDTRISSLGVVDGKLHVQHFVLDFDWHNIGRIHLVDPYGERVDSTQFAAFSIGDTGPYWRPSWQAGYQQSMFQDLIFPVNLDRLSEYRLVANFNVHGTINNIDWSVSFATEAFEMYLLAEDLDIPLGRGQVLHEVRLTPFAMNLHIYGPWDSFQGYYDAASGIKINTVDGIIEGELRGATRVDNLHRSTLVNWEGGLLDLDKVISVEVAGETILFP